MMSSFSREGIRYFVKTEPWVLDIQKPTQTLVTWFTNYFFLSGSSKEANCTSRRYTRLRVEKKSAKITDLLFTWKIGTPDKTNFPDVIGSSARANLALKIGLCWTVCQPPVEILSNLKSSTNWWPKEKCLKLS